MVGAHASFTLENESLDGLAALAADSGTGVHIHVAEDAVDEEDSMKRCGQRTALRLSSHGVLGHDSIAAHGVHLDGTELNVIHESGSWLVHNCRSNMNNGVGRAPLGGFGDRAALGTDGIDGDMFAESRTAYFRTRETSLEAYAEQYTGMLAQGADLASRFFPQPVGTLQVGSAADLMVLRYDPPTPLTAENLTWHWMFALSAQSVESVMVAGRWVVRDRQFCTLDEEKIRAEAREEASRVWRRMDAL
jgi:cytosine/adenosine deaminase-related metal-dependent hydrolase